MLVFVGDICQLSLFVIDDSGLTGLKFVFIALKSHLRAFQAMIIFFNFYLIVNQIITKQLYLKQKLISLNFKLCVSNIITYCVDLIFI